MVGRGGIKHFSMSVRVSNHFLNIFSSKRYTLDSIVEDQNIVKAVAFRQAVVVNFLLENVNELIAKAFNGDGSIDVKKQNKYDLVLRELIEKYSQDIIKKSNFLEYIDSLSETVLNKKKLKIPEIKKLSKEDFQEKSSDEKDDESLDESSDDSSSSSSSSDEESPEEPQKSEEEDKEKVEIKEIPQKEEEEVKEPCEIQESTLIAAAEAFRSIIKAQVDNSIFALSEHPNFFVALVRSMHYSSIYDILSTISLQNSRPLKFYFEAIKASKIIIDIVKETHDPRALIVLINIINLSSPTSIVVRDLANEETLQWILDVTFESTDSVFVGNCYKLLFSLFLQVEYDDYSDIDSDSEEDSETIPILTDFFKGCFEKVVDFCVQEDRKFRCDKGAAITLAARMIPFVEADKEILEKLLDYLFELMLSNPCITAIHNSFILIFEACKDSRISLEDFDKRCSVKLRIARLFRKKRETLANYWCHLHIVADSYVSFDELDPVEEGENTETYMSEDGDEISISDNDSAGLEQEIEIEKPDNRIGFFQPGPVDEQKRDDNDSSDQDISSDFSDGDFSNSDSAKSQSIDSEGYNTLGNTNNGAQLIGSFPRSGLRPLFPRMNTNNFSTGFSSFAGQNDDNDSPFDAPLSSKFKNDDEDEDENYSSSDSEDEDDDDDDSHFLPPEIPSFASSAPLSSPTLGGGSFDSGYNPPQLMAPPPIPQIPVVSFVPSSTPSKPLVLSKNYKGSMISDEEFGTDPWKYFVSEVFKSMSNIMAMDYGGRVPGYSDEDVFKLSSDDDY